MIKDEQASLSVEVATVKFGGSPQLAQDFTTIQNFTPSGLDAGGWTPMGEAIQCALDLLEDRKNTYKESGIQYYRPWVFLIRDGAPNHDSPWREAAQRQISLRKL